MNLGSYIVLAILLVIVGLAIYSMVKTKRAGKSISCGDCSCGGSCDGTSCPSAKLAVDLAKSLQDASENAGNSKDSLPQNR